MQRVLESLVPSEDAHSGYPDTDLTDRVGDTGLRAGMVVAPESSQPAGAAMSTSDACGPSTVSTGDAAPFVGDDDTGSDTDEAEDAEALTSYNHR